MAQNSEAAAGGPRSIHSNGSVLCDKWYRYGKCSRSDCGFAHRDALPGKDIIPPCHDYFTLKDKCARGTNCKLLHTKGSTLVPVKGAPKVSGSRGGGNGGSSSLASDRPVFILPEKPKTRENDKASTIAKSKTVPDPSGRPSGGERGSIVSQAPTGPVFHARDPRRDNNRGSNLTQERSMAVKGDNKAGAVNTLRPSPKPPVAYSEHVHNIAHSKERNDWGNRRPLLTTHGTRTAPREAKAELSQLGDEAGDGKHGGGVSLEIPGPKTSVADALAPNFHAAGRKVDVAGNTSNTARGDNKARSINTGSAKTTCQPRPAPRDSSGYGSSPGGGYGFRNSSAFSPATADRQRVMTSDSNHLMEESRTISGVIEPKPPISNSLKEFLKIPCTESFGRDMKEDQLFQISSGGVRLLDKFARQYASDPDAIQRKYGRLCFLLQADPRRDFPHLRYTVETHRSMFWQLDPVRLGWVDSGMIKPEASPRDETTGDLVRKTSSGIFILDQDSSEWGSRDVSQNTHRSHNQVARTTSEYSVSTGRAPPRPAEVAPKEHGGGYPSKDRLSYGDRACAILGGRRGAYSGNGCNGQSQAILVDADRMPLERKGGAFSDYSGATTVVSTQTLTGTDRAVTVESLDLTTSKRKGILSENNAAFYPNARAPERANGGSSKGSEEGGILLEPVVKKQVARDVYTCGAPGVVAGAVVPPSPKDSAPSTSSGPSSLDSSPSSGPAPPLGARQQPTGSGDGESLNAGETGDCIESVEVPKISEKPLEPPAGTQRSCFASRDEAKMALAVSLQKPGQFATKGKPDPQQSDVEIQEVPSWMNESDSGNETPSVWEWDWDKKSSQTGLTDDEWSVGVPLDRASVENFDGAAEKAESPVSLVERVFELPKDPGNVPNPRDREAGKSRCVGKYRAKGLRESSGGKGCESPMLANHASEPQVPGDRVVKQPVPGHKASKPPVPENKARKPPVSHHKVSKPPVPVNRANESIVSAGVNGKLVASEGYSRNPPRSRNNGDAGAPISRGRFSGGCGGINKLPEEILHVIFSYAADGVLPEVQVKTKDLTYGSSFEAPSSFNKIRYRGLRSVLRTCHHWRTLGQEILCKYVNLSEWSNLELFSRTLSHDRDIGALVRSLRVSVPPFGLRASYQSYNNRDRNSRAVVSEQVDAFHLLPEIMQGCSLIHVMSIDMPNAVPVFNKLVSAQKFPNLREIRMKDGGERIATGERVWENIIRNMPELRRLLIMQDQDLSLRNAPTYIRIPENIFHSEKASTFKLTQIHLTRSYQISDDILLLLCAKLGNLNDLDIIDCPLVTSRGIARMLEKLPNQLTRLSFWIWINHYGNVSRREQEIGVDLCHALSKYGQSLQHMDIKIFLACHHLWQDGFRELQRCRIVPVHYHDCVKQENIRSSSFFKNVLDEGRNAGKFPALTECRV